MHNLTIGFGLLLTILCILDVSHGNEKQPSLFKRMFSRSSSKVEPASTTVQEEESSKVEPASTTVQEEESLTDFNALYTLYGLTRIADADMEEIRDDILKKANHYRQLHKLSDYQWSNKLANLGQDWAIKAAGFQWDYFQNKVDTKYSVLFFRMTPFNHVGEILVDTMYMQLPYCYYGTNEETKAKNELAISVYQLLWKNSKSMGVGIAKNKYLNLYHFVAVFDPKGNVPGEYAANEPEFSVKQAFDEYAKEKYFDTALGGKDFESNFGETKPDLPGWSSLYYPSTPPVVIDSKCVDRTSQEFKKLFGNRIIE